VVKPRNRVRYELAGMMNLLQATIGCTECATKIQVNARLRTVPAKLETERKGCGRQTGVPWEILRLVCLSQSRAWENLKTASESAM
jgi:hypothetical protein